MPKAAPKNGYYYFMVDFRKREEQAGRRFKGMDEVATAASDEWKSLPQTERDEYNAWAKDQRGTEERKNVAKKPKPLEKKFNSEGRNLADLKRELEEKKRYDREIWKFVERFIQTKSADELKNEVLHLIHVNYFCETADEENTYYPAELAISKCSLKDGLIDTFHTFMAPGPDGIKKGYRYALKERSDRFHKITLEYVQSIPGTHDYEQIYDDICKFLELGRNGKKSVPLFTMTDSIFHNNSFKAVEKTMEGLWEGKYSSKDKNEWKKFFPVYQLQHLLYQLKNAGYRYSKNEPIDLEEREEDERAFPNATLAEIELNKDTYNMKDEYACNYHVDMDAVTHCSLSFVSRWAQIIRDHCCPFFNIDLIQPVESNDFVSESDFRTAASFGSRAPSYVPSVQEDEEDDDDAYGDCRSMVSGYSVKTNVTCKSEDSVRFLPDEECDRASKSSYVTKSSNVWHGGRGRAARAAAAPPVDDDNFPSLGGMSRGMRRLNLK